MFYTHVQLTYESPNTLKCIHTILHICQEMRRNFRNTLLMYCLPPLLYPFRRSAVGLYTFAKEKRPHFIVHYYIFYVCRTIATNGKETLKKCARCTLQADNRLMVRPVSLCQYIAILQAMSTATLPLLI